MRFVASLAFVAYLSAGCGHDHAPTTMKWSQRVLVVSLIGVLASSIGAAAGSRNATVKDAFIAADVTFGAAAATSVGVYLAADASDDGPPMTERERKQAQAWQLTKRAREQARKGNCKAVQQIEPVVKTEDPGFYEVVFMRDVAIRSCLSAK
jgi:hypothetical protein